MATIIFLITCLTLSGCEGGEIILMGGAFSLGQMYLSTTIFVMGMPELRVRATLYLLLYSLAFILPLMAVICLAFLGITSQQLRLFVTRQIATIKLLTAGLLFLLRAWLIMMV